MKYAVRKKMRRNKSIYLVIKLQISEDKPLSWCRSDGIRDPFLCVLEAEVKDAEGAH